MGRPAFTAQTIALARGPARLGRPVIFFDRVGSTNDVACRQAAAGAAEGLLVVADEQTAGRGRMGRSWWLAKGAGLLFSLVVRPAVPPVRTAELTMCLGLAAAEAIESVTGLRPALKWPNDLLLNGRKLGGMLAELRTDGDRVEYAVLGLGLNVNAAPDGLDATAICLAEVLYKDVDRGELLVEILAKFEAWHERWMAGEPVHTRWAARLDTLGRDVTVATANGLLHGRAIAVSSEGALFLETTEGRLHMLWGGDVTLAVPPLGRSPRAVL